jgi:hypothetical protein
MLARGNLKAGQYEQAFGRLLELVKERVGSRLPGLQTRMPTMTLGPDYQVDIDAWIAVHLAQVFEKASPEQKQKMLAVIQERMRVAAGSHPLARQSELRYLMWLEDSHPAILTMANGLLGGHDQTKAERMLQPLLFSRNSEIREHVEALLKQKTNAENKAIDAYQAQVFDTAPGGLVPIEPTDTTTRTKVLPTDADWPRGMIEAAVATNSAPVNYPQLRVRQTSNRYGRGPVELRLVSEHLRVLDAYGNQIGGDAPFEEMRTEPFDPMMRAQINGGLIFMETSRELVVFDMYRSGDPGMEPVLWRHSLLRVTPNPNKPHAPQQAIPETNPMWMRTYMRGSERETVVGPVTPSGIIIQKGPDIILLDALTGLPVWSRGGYSNKTTFVAFGLEVAVVSSESPTIDVLDCRDGSLIRQTNQPDAWKPLFAAGRHLLQFKAKATPRKTPIVVDTPDACDVRLLDPFVGKVLTETSFAPNARADSCEDRYLVVMEESGRTWYCNAETGQVAEHMLDKQPKLAQVRAQLFGDRLVAWGVLPIQSSNSPRVFPEPDETTINRGLYPINGSIIALDAESGKLLWDRAGSLMRFTFNTAQPRHSPFIGFYRTVGSPGNRQAHLAVVDLRDGTLAYVSSSLPLSNAGGENNEFAMRIDPSRNGVLCSIGNTSIMLKVTDQEKPPQPVCFYGSLVKPKQVGAPFLPLR